MALDIFQFPCLEDNYGVLVHDPVSGRTASIDAPEASAVLAALKERGWHLTDLFATHHHVDHVQGILEVKAATGCTVTGPAGEADKIPGIDRAVREGDTIDFAGHPVKIIETPGHTLGHIAYYFPEDEVAFVGDTLFALGCGRVFEGTLEQMWRSVEKIGALPAETKLYVGHEYTQSNWRFATAVDPTNQALAARGEVIARLRADGKPTVPTNVAIERATNPYLRAGTGELRTSMGLPNGTPAEVFAAIRTAKDTFKG